MNSNQIPKIIVCGSSGCGKTTMSRLQIDENFMNKHISTLGVEVHPLYFGFGIKFNVWDCAGNEQFKGLGEDYWIEANGAIVMFDCSSEESEDNALRLYNRMKEKFGDNFPILIVGNKVDLALNEPFDETRDVFGGIEPRGEIEPFYVSLKNEKKEGVRKIFSSLYELLK